MAGKRSHEHDSLGVKWKDRRAQLRWNLLLICDGSTLWLTIDQPFQGAGTGGLYVVTATMGSIVQMYSPYRVFLHITTQLVHV